jgi:hypothetical protein
MKDEITENLNMMCDVFNQHFGEISFIDYKNFYEYYIDILSLNINYDFNSYCKYMINDVMNKHYHYTTYLRLQKLQKINKENDITN